jgi:thioredoxin 1
MIYVTTLNNENYESFINNEYSLVDLYADWCAPCKNITPIINELSSDYKDKVSFGKCNVDENREIVSTLGIRNIPTILLYKNGKIVDKLVGANNKQNFIEALEKLIN